MEEALANAAPSAMTYAELWNTPPYRTGEGFGAGFIPNLLDVGESGSVRTGWNGHLVEVRLDGVQTLRVEMPDDESLLGRASFAVGRDTYARTTFPGRLTDHGELLRWTRFTTPAGDEPSVLTPVIPEIDLRARFNREPAGTRYDVPYGSLALDGDEALWVIRQAPRYVAPEVFVHLLRADFDEPMGPMGRRLRRPLRHTWHFETTLEVAADGSLWYLADWAPLGERLPGEAPVPVAPDGTRRGPRAVRVAPDGTVTVSSILVDTGTVLGTAEGILTGGVWSALDDEGAYLVHFGVQRADVRSWASVFARILPDGTVAWIRMTPEPYACVRDGALQNDPAIQHDGEGGFVFAFTNVFAPYEIRIGRLDRDGNWTLGEEGMLVQSFPPTAADGGTALWNMDMDVDGEGGYFIVWIDMSDGSPTVAHFDEAGAETWRSQGLVFHRQAEIDPGTQLSVRHDRHGGAWLSSNNLLYADLQHVDRTGRPLFYYLGTGHPPSCWARRLPVVAWPEPDGPIISYLDGAPYEPDPASLDAGAEPVDAGAPFDADLDAGPITDAPLDGGHVLDAGP